VRLISSKIRSDLALSFGSQVAYKFVGYLVLAVLARYLSLDDLGKFFYASTLAGVAVLFTELGTSDLLVRAVAQDRARAASWIGQVLSLRVPLLTGYVTLLAAWAWLAEPDLAPVVVLAALYVGMKDLYRACSSVLLGLRSVGTTVVLYGGGMALLLLLVFEVVRAGGGLGAILLAYCGWTAALLSAGLLTVRHRVGSIPLRSGLAGMGPMLRSSLPLFLMAVTSLVHFKVDTLMLGFMRSYQEVAIYEAGAKLLEASRFLVRPLTLIFYPVCAEMAGRAEWTGLRPLVRKIALAAVGLAVTLAAGVIVLAPWIVPAVFGSGFDDSVPVLRILSLSVPFLFLASIGSFLAMVLEVEGRAIGILSLGVAANVGLNAVLIPKFGGVGAAWTTVCSEAIVASGLLILVLRTLHRRGKQRVPAHA